MMSEHKLREAGNGDGDKKKISSHIVEVIYSPIWGDEVDSRLEEAIESAYTRLSERAERENSLILGVVQAVHTYTVVNKAFVLIIVTAQRISREDFERQQRMAQFSGGPRR